MQRQESYDISQRFINRWSPRSFDENYSLSDEDIHKIFEAARWSPSSYNHQPWTFLYEKKGGPHYEKFLGLLNDFNKDWAHRASMIGIIVASIFDDKGEANAHAQFDCGAAWMALTMQARDLGLYTHGMGGINYEKCYKELEIPRDSHKVICGFVIGKKGEPSKLPAKLEKQEEMNDRKPTDKIIFNGNFKQRSS